MSQNQPMTLSDFLLARIAEDEEAARNMARSVMRGETPPRLGFPPHFQHYLTTQSPARVFTECEAKRRIINRARGWLDEEPDGTVADTIARDLLGHVVRTLALPYADHPDYREEWRP